MRVLTPCSVVVVACMLGTVVRAQDATPQPAPDQPSAPQPETPSSPDQAEPSPAHLAHPQAQPAACWAEPQVFSPDETERALKKIRSKYFRTRNVPTRQLGIAELRTFTDYRAFPIMLEVFDREKDDVRLAVLDHFLDQRTPQGDAALAWVAIHDRDESQRAAAGERLLERFKDDEVTHGVKSIMASAIKSDDNDLITRSAHLAGMLKLYEAIPALITAQVSSGGGSSGGSGGGAIAQIVVATQEAFVSDLTPVVGDSAVAFDPEIGVITNGVVLRVDDAVTTTYRVEAHRALLGLASDAWGGRSVAHLGYDEKKWIEWYNTELKPYLAARAREPDAAPSARDDG